MTNSGRRRKRRRPRGVSKGQITTRELKTTGMTTTTGSLRDDAPVESIKGIGEALSKELRAKRPSIKTVADYKKYLEKEEKIMEKEKISKKISKSESKSVSVGTSSKDIKKEKKRAKDLKKEKDPVTLQDKLDLLQKKKRYKTYLKDDKELQAKLRAKSQSKWRLEDLNNFVEETQYFYLKDTQTKKDDYYERLDAEISGSIERNLRGINAIEEVLERNADILKRLEEEHEEYLSRTKKNLVKSPIDYSLEKGKKKYQDELDKELDEYKALDLRYKKDKKAIEDDIAIVDLNSQLSKLVKEFELTDSDLDEMINYGVSRSYYDEDMVETARKINYKDKDLKELKEKYNIRAGYGIPRIPKKIDEMKLTAQDKRNIQAIFILKSLEDKRDWVERQISTNNEDIKIRDRLKHNTHFAGEYAKRDRYIESVNAHSDQIRMLNDFILDREEAHEERKQLYEQSTRGFTTSPIGLRAFKQSQWEADSVDLQTVQLMKEIRNVGVNYSSDWDESIKLLPKDSDNIMSDVTYQNRVKEIIKDYVKDTGKFPTSSEVLNNVDISGIEISHYSGSKEPLTKSQFKRYLETELDLTHERLGKQWIKWAVENHIDKEWTNEELIQQHSVPYIMAILTYSDTSYMTGLQRDTDQVLRRTTDFTTIRSEIDYIKRERKEELEREQKEREEEQGREKEQKDLIFKREKIWERTTKKKSQSPSDAPKWVYHRGAIPKGVFVKLFKDGSTQEQFTVLSNWVDRKDYWGNLREYDTPLDNIESFEEGKGDVREGGGRVLSGGSAAYYPKGNSQIQFEEQKNLGITVKELNELSKEPQRGGFFRDSRVEKQEKNRLDVDIFKDISSFLKSNSEVRQSKSGVYIFKAINGKGDVIIAPGEDEEEDAGYVYIDRD